MIRETITFNFDTAEQQRRFHDRLEGDGEGFASQVWGLALFAHTQLADGDVVGAKTTLKRIAEVADAKIDN